MSYIMNKCGNYIPLFLFLKFTSVSLPLSLSAFFIYIEILIHISTSFELEQLFPMSWVILFS